MKILAIKFKYLGDIMVMIPALRALRVWQPNGELHVLVAEEAAPLLQHLPWIDRLWAFPRKRGRAQPFRSLPMLQELRAQHFDYSVDFVGNDRGAFVSLFAGARRRLGLNPPLGFWGRKWCYHQTRVDAPMDRHESVRDWELLQPWQVPAPTSWDLEIQSNPALRSEAETLLPKPSVICHLSTSQPKKEWPLEYWLRLAAGASDHRIPLVFSSGPSTREQQLLEKLRQQRPEIQCLPSGLSLELFLAVLSRASVFVSGDTGPLHFAAGLAIPTVSLFGPTFSRQWSPQGARHQLVSGGICSCSGHAHVCTSASPCILEIHPDLVAEKIRDLLAPQFV